MTKMGESMLNFTVGPVMSSEEVLAISGQSAPYFRTSDFSEVMLQSEQLMLELLSAPDDARCVFLTCSGTGAMESVVMNVLSPSDRVIAVNGGSFGQRFVDLCRLHGCSVAEVGLEFGAQIAASDLDAVSDGATALVVNMHETSSGLLYDMNLISQFCKSHGILLVVDAISAFIADELDMAKLDADVVITGSQKALACHPGVAVVALSRRAQERVVANPERCLYLSLREALLNGERGQTPWTPAVATLLQINARLRGLKAEGLPAERSRIAMRAKGLRGLASELGYKQVPEAPSNAVTALWAPDGNARAIIDAAKTRYGIWLCPNGGDHANDVFRIGHIGSISESDQSALLAALRDVASR